MKEEHPVQDPNALLTTLSNMALKPEVTFDKLFQKLYNVELWLLAYQKAQENLESRICGNAYVRFGGGFSET